MHSMRFIAVLDDCNDSKEAGNDQMQEEGEGERMRRRREEEREKGREGRIQRRREGERKEGRKEGRERGRKRGKRRVKGGGKEGRRKGRRKSALGERGARSTCTLYERNPRRRRWAVVHFMHDYDLLSEYHAHLRPIILNTMHDSD